MITIALWFKCKINFEIRYIINIDIEGLIFRAEVLYLDNNSAVASFSKEFTCIKIISKYNRKFILYLNNLAIRRNTIIFLFYN